MGALTVPKKSSSESGLTGRLGGVILLLPIRLSFVPEAEFRNDLLLMLPPLGFRELGLVEIPESVSRNDVLANR
jgi:hypothetical protein